MMGPRGMENPSPHKNFSSFRHSWTWSLRVHTLFLTLFWIHINYAVFAVLPPSRFSVPPPPLYPVGRSIGTPRCPDKSSQDSSSSSSSTGSNPAGVTLSPAWQPFSGEDPLSRGYPSRFSVPPPPLPPVGRSIVSRCPDRSIYQDSSSKRHF